MRRILLSLLSPLLLTSCVAQENMTVAQEMHLTPGSTEPTLSVSSTPSLIPTKKTVLKSDKKIKDTSSVKTETTKKKESSVFYSLKKYMELHGLPNQTAGEYAHLIETYSSKYGRDPYLVLAIIHVETGSTYYNNTKPNDHGAVGLMQMLERNLDCNNTQGCYNPIWSGYTKKDLKIPDRNIELGVTYLKYLQDRFGYMLGITAYNQGEGNVSRGTYRTWYTNKVLGALERIKKGQENRY
ncbi:transglycosylase SLT domain-containing protein [Brevibacillus laterosporus]|uniref:transglycosylase SLT domain-containing protein n=1 Tax=Brevibacillus laterosporus TaxID=1465 RepID=UPI003D1BC44B